MLPSRTGNSSINPTCHEEELSQKNTCLLFSLEIRKHAGMRHKLILTWRLQKDLKKGETAYLASIGIISCNRFDLGSISLTAVAVLEQEKAAR